MNSMLATEPAPDKAPDVPGKPHVPVQLETWAQNERMRHVPVAGWIVHKLDADVRRRIEKLYVPFAALAFDDPRHVTIETELRNVCRALDRLAEVARHSRNGHPPNDLGQRIRWALDHAIQNLETLDPNLIGRRFPYHTFERSKGEPLYAALLVVMQSVERVATLVRTIDPGIDERLLEGLVVLSNPVDERMLKPIA